MQQRLRVSLSLLLLFSTVFSAGASDLTKNLIVNAGHNVLYMLGLVSTKPKPLFRTYGSSNFILSDIRPETGVTSTIEAQVSITETNQSEKTSTISTQISKEELCVRYEQQYGTTPHKRETISVRTDAGSVGNFLYDLGNILAGSSAKERARDREIEQLTKELNEKIQHGLLNPPSEDELNRAAQRAIADNINKLSKYSDERLEQREQNLLGWKKIQKKRLKHVNQVEDAQKRITGFNEELAAIHQERLDHIHKNVTTLSATTAVLLTQTASITKSTVSMVPIDTKEAAIGHMLEDMHNQKNDINIDDDIARFQQVMQEPASSPNSGSAFLPQTPHTLALTQRIEMGGAAVGLVSAAEKSVELLTPGDHPIDPYVGHLARWSLGSCFLGLTTTGAALAAGEALAPGTVIAYTGPAFIGACKYCFVAAPAAGALATGHTVANIVDYATSPDPNHKFFNNNRYAAKYMHEQNQLLEAQRIAIQPQQKPNKGCGSTTPVEPFKEAGLIPVPMEKPEPLINVPYIPNNKPLINVPVEQKNAEDYILTKDKNSDKFNNDKKEEKKERYSGPQYDRTEGWISENPLGKYFDRTHLGMQGKRAFRLKKKVPGITGIAEGESVVIDAQHKDHLEVYDKNNKWSHVANFDGTKNIEKSEQGKNEPRKPLHEL